MGIKESIAGTLYAGEIVYSLFARTVDEEKTDLAKDAAQYQRNFPVNVEEALLPEMLALTQHLPESKHELTPYWAQDKTYDPAYILGIAINFTDQATQNPPQEIFPPEDDIKKYIDLISSSSEPCTISQQFRYLLEISEGNIAGAAFLGMMASRLMARNMETSTYPHILLSEDEVRKWTTKVAKFDTVEEHTSEPAGDTYYYWTHFLAAYTASRLNNKSGDALNLMFENGSQVMAYVRATLVKQPVIGGHTEASTMGRHMGLAIAETEDIFVHDTAKRISDYLEKKLRPEEDVVYTK